MLLLLPYVMFDLMGLIQCLQAEESYSAEHNVVQKPPMLLTIPALQLYFFSSYIIVFLEPHLGSTVWGHRGFILEYNAIYLHFSFLSQ